MRHRLHLPRAGTSRSLAGRIGGSPLPVELRRAGTGGGYRGKVVLDIDTGGGETLGEVLGGIPDSIASSRTVVATEPYPPNLPVAAERLGPLGVDVRAQIDILPVEDAFADLVLNRHGALDTSRSRQGAASRRSPVDPNRSAPENDAELNAALSYRRRAAEHRPRPSSKTCSRWGWSSMKRKPRRSKLLSAISVRSSTNYGWWAGRFPTSTCSEPTAPARLPWTPAFVGMVRCRYGAVEYSYVLTGREMEAATFLPSTPGPDHASKVGDPSDRGSGVREPDGCARILTAAACTPEWGRSFD